MQKDMLQQRGITEEKIIKKYMPLILKYSRLAPENDREDLEQELIIEIIELYRNGKC